MTNNLLFTKLYSPAHLLRPYLPNQLSPPLAFWWLQVSWASSLLIAGHSQQYSSRTFPSLDDPSSGDPTSLGQKCKSSCGVEFALIELNVCWVSIWVFSGNWLHHCVVVYQWGITAALVNPSILPNFCMVTSVDRGSLLSLEIHMCTTVPFCCSSATNYSGGCFLPTGSGLGGSSDGEVAALVVFFFDPATLVGVPAGQVPTYFFKNSSYPTIRQKKYFTQKSKKSIRQRTATITISKVT